MILYYVVKYQFTFLNIFRLLFDQITAIRGDGSLQWLQNKHKGALVTLTANAAIFNV